MDSRFEVVRPKDAAAIDGLSDSARNREQVRGTHVKPFKLSTDPRSRAVGYFHHELADRRDAVIAGCSDDELRVLVKSQEDARVQRGKPIEPRAA